MSLSRFWPQMRDLPPPYTIASPVPWLVLWLHSGRLRPASGTWGSLAALPFVLLIQYEGGWPTTLCFAFLCFVAGLWAIPRYLKICGQDDPSEIVLDEVVGMALTCTVLGRLDALTILFAFALFRLFDAVKRGPVGWVDRHVGGAWGVLLDDVVAGLLAAFCLYGYQRLI